MGFGRSSGESNNWTKNCRIGREDNDAAFVKLDSFISNVVLTFNDETV